MQTAIGQGQFAYVLGPRQIGKSSLRIQAAYWLTQSGLGQCAAVQATQLQTDSEKDLLCTLYTELVADHLQPFLPWLERTTRLSAVDRLIQFVDDFLIDRLAKHAVVLFIDEIDALLDTSLNSVLFEWMAKCYELRAANPAYEQLSFVVLGAAIAGDLPQAGFLFSLGKEISLPPFSLTETQALKTSFKAHLEDPTTLINAIYRWVHGQPFLTQKLCQIISTTIDGLVQPSFHPIQISPPKLNQWVDNIVRSHIIQDWQTKDNPIHLRAIGRRINLSFNQKALLSLYRELRLNHPIKVNGSYTQAELCLSGLVRE